MNCIFQLTSRRAGASMTRFYMHHYLLDLPDVYRDECVVGGMSSTTVDLPDVYGDECVVGGVSSTTVDLPDVYRDESVVGCVSSTTVEAGDGIFR